LLVVERSATRLNFKNADVAQLVEHHLAKVDVASSNLVVRSLDPYWDPTQDTAGFTGSGRLAQR
jgi:hypothetical protein